MHIFYIDVYFLINFTVDLLALYISAIATKVKGTLPGLIIASAIGSVFASVVALYSIKGIFFAVLLVLSALIGIRVFSGKITGLRRLKLLLAFIICETFIGGFVTLLYNMMDKYFAPIITDEDFSPKNRHILILALFVLLGYSMLKLIYFVFKGDNTRVCCNLKFNINSFEIVTEGLIDSGSLLTDPIDGSPVLIVKSSVSNDFSLNFYNNDLKSKIRVIPTKSIGGSRLLLGFIPDAVFLNGKKIDEKIIVAIDNEEGSFGGYMALVPSSVADL